MDQQHSFASRTTRLALFGVNCRICAAQVREHLENVPGVTEVQLRFAQRQAVVHFDPIMVQEQHLVERLHSAGYGAMITPCGARRNHDDVSGVL